MFGGKDSVLQGDLFIQGFMKINVFTTEHDKILFFSSIYNKVHQVKNHTGLIIFSYQTLFMGSLMFECT